MLQVTKKIISRHLGRYLSKIFKFDICFGTFLSISLIFPLTIDSFNDQSAFLPSDMLNRHSRGSSIICLGDSLTQGVGASPGRDYPSLLSRGLGLPVINAGADGDETEDALQRLDRDVLSKDPRIVIILLGANDYLNEKPMERTFENLDEIIRRIQARGAMVVIVEIGTTILGDSIQEAYNQLVLKRRTAFVQLGYKDILFNPSLRSDLRHPNDQGYQIIAGRILKVVKPLLKNN